eukprot:TRINITY_DN1256_c0_g2_i1.p1 TRINITY_DN1256_c0_g2~~TRINITY_DN1256_c0_g2_i1.p1  ORF type:complete len:423 (+),score=58.68 TRINITY_DN1256_c0_g2_i1:410-1678(+)
MSSPPIGRVASTPSISALDRARRSQSALGSGSDETTPLLGSSSRGLDRRSPGDGSRGSRSRTMEAARYLRRAGSGRIMRDEPFRVRENAAEQLEETQSDWANSRPVVVLDIIWNLAFVIVACVILFLSRRENPPTPLRVWVLGYAVQCLLHMGCVWSEYQRRQQHILSRSGEARAGLGGRRGSQGSLSSASSDSGVALPDDSGREEVEEEREEREVLSLAKQFEHANTMFSIMWWMAGFYWIASAGPNVSQVAPQLYWLSVVFLAFEVFFVVFCLAIACVVGIAVCCCLPCIIAFLYAVSEQEGATEQEINQIPRFKFCRNAMVPPNTFSIGAANPVDSPKSGTMVQIGSDAPSRTLAAEDAECCICLSIYDDGAELRELPCNHHFHLSCIDKWLRINAICPLCKFNIHQNRNVADRNMEEP